MASQTPPQVSVYSDMSIAGSAAQNIITMRQTNREVMRIEANGDAVFQDVTFNKKVIDSLISGTSFLISRCDEGWYINNEFVGDEDFDSSIISKVAKSNLVTGHLKMEDFIRTMSKA